jgi:lysophospholipase L1-like esterase
MTKFYSLGLAGVFLAGAPLLEAELVWKEGERIVFLGDSITRNGAVPPEGFIHLIQERLASDDMRIEVIPRGIGGHKSPQMLARLQADVLDRKPDWLVLSCGVNDVWHGANGVALEDYRRHMTEIVVRSQAQGIKVVLLTATPIGEDSVGVFNRQLAGYNAFLRELAADRGCLLADLNDAMRRELERETNAANGAFRLTVDGVHLNAAGNRLAAETILDALGADRAEDDES